MYKEASKLKLRFQTTKGSLSVEQLWEVSMTAIATIVRNLKKELKKDNDDDLSFLDEGPSTVDKVAQLRFDVAKDVYLTKRAEKDAADVAAETKAHNQKILELIKEKQEDQLKGKSIAEINFN